MLIEHFLQDFAEGIAGYPFSPAMPERLRITESLLKGDNPRLRSLAAPFYVTDLGVRYFNDPNTFYLEHCKTAHIIPVSSIEITNALNRRFEYIASALDAIILFFGDFETCAAVIKSNKADLLQISSYKSLIYCGEILAALSDDLSIIFFEEAARIADSTSYAYAAQHRAAAFETKRRNNYSDSHLRLNRLIKEYEIPEDSLEYALYLNLDALNMVMAKKSDDEILSALFTAAYQGEKYCQSDSISHEDKTKAIRYINQIYINVAQIYLGQDKVEKAIAALKHNLDNCSLYAPEYMCEMLAEIAYFEYLNTNYHKALELGNNAFLLYRQIGAISAMKQTRQVIVGSLYKIGYTEEAIATAELIDKDPLGLSWKPTI